MITDPQLLERQLIPDAQWLAHYVELIGQFPPREWTREAFERSLRYPWYRPDRSYLLRGTEVRLLHELEPAERARILEGAKGREPLLAIGSNAAPRNLAVKLAHHERPEDREVVVLAGELHGLDVVGCAALALYGAVPATLAASPGTSVRAALLLVNPTQLTTLTWGELSYRIGRLRGAPFTVEDGFDGLELASPLAFVSRWGAFAPDGDPCPLAAIPARDRRWRAWTQEELLDRVAELVLGGGGAEAVTHAVHADVGGTAARALPILARHAQPFDFPDWEPIGPDGSL